MPSRFTLPHIDIRPLAQRQNYLGSSSGGSGTVRIRAEHGRRMQRELNAALAIVDADRPHDPRLGDPSGSFVEVRLVKEAKSDVLDQKTSRIRSGAAKLEENNDRSVLLYLPDGARPAFQKILDDYLYGELTPRAGKPPNKAKVEAIEAFRAARLERFWTDDPAALPQTKEDAIWWGLWCWMGGEENVESACDALNVRVAGRDRRLYFPEVVVIPVLASRAAIELLLFTTGEISELRRASDSPAFFIDDVRTDQLPWVENLAERLEWPGANVPSVCIFDTGVNRAHVLIEPALAVTDQHAVNRDWSVDDNDGHGTGMAGLALHGDLTAPLADKEHRVLKHRVESVKILPPGGFPPTEPRSYGPITQAAVALPEIMAPERSRVFCMAITNENVSGARPTAWSAAIDQASAGEMPGDGNDAPMRLFILSAGNVPAEGDFARLRSQDDYPIEDPAQAWNALTIGGYTDLTQIHERDYLRWTPLVPAGQISPHSRTSVTWPGKTPFKPELVMEAGNRAVNPNQTEVLTLGSLSLLTTGSDVDKVPLVQFDATSAATAQAARLAARLSADHPEFWPETVRALMVHSAEWTPIMLASLGDAASKRDRYELIRRFGYGVPDYERATASASHHLALFAQAEIQPFRLDGTRKFNECHYYTLPIPRGMLEDLINEIVELKITLSYFIDPNPGLSANIDPARYQSHGLRFDLRRKGEAMDVFKQRVNASERDDPRVPPRAEPDDARWMFGAQSISCGSLHCDTWTGPAIELAGRDLLCIKPVVGWARERASREICNKVRRYGLIVSLKARNQEIDLYTPISIAVEPLVEVATDIFA